MRKILVTGATGFVGRPLVDALVRRGEQVVATSRNPMIGNAADAVEWRSCDVYDPASLERAVAGTDIAYYLVHQVGGRRSDLHAAERRAAENFARAVEAAGVGRVVYLGATAPVGEPSAHLASRLEVGELLRASAVPTLELRAAIVIGYGGASWTLTADLATRLPPIVILPTWLGTRVAPVAIEDVVVALVRAADVELDRSAWYDLPGPELLTGRQILDRVAALHGRRIRGITLPFVTPWLSAFVIRLWTDLDYGTLRDLVPGFRSDILPADDRYWGAVGHDDLVTFDDAIRRAAAISAGELV